MKKTYIQPQTMEEFTQCEMMLAASMFDVNKDSQVITPIDEEYDGEFTVKEYRFGDDF